MPNETHQQIHFIAQGIKHRIRDYKDDASNHRACNIAMSRVWRWDKPVNYFSKPTENHISFLLLLCVIKNCHLLLCSVNFLIAPKQSCLFFSFLNRLHFTDFNRQNTGQRNIHTPSEWPMMVKNNANRIFVNGTCLRACAKKQPRLQVVNEPVEMSNREMSSFVDSIANK